MRYVLSKVGIHGWVVSGRRAPWLNQRFIEGGIILISGKANLGDTSYQPGAARFIQGWYYLITATMAIWRRGNMNETRTFLCQFAAGYIIEAEYVHKSCPTSTVS